MFYFSSFLPKKINKLNRKTENIYVYVYVDFPLVDRDVLLSYHSIEQRTNICFILCASSKTVFFLRAVFRLNLNKDAAERFHKCLITDE